MLIPLQYMVEISSSSGSRKTWWRSLSENRTILVSMLGQYLPAQCEQKISERDLTGRDDDPKDKITLVGVVRLCEMDARTVFPNFYLTWPSSLLQKK